ncbi:hypothetical protein [Nonomuraea diastatica]|uniref:Uncharacterized protein n=1 Tax=Nonomuraea diastatica TaxID=1848329 RepID=A0A4R4X473_9ACTN|nr:hypothetical protein [Nonomuraea diastatica]TDD25100.1 hypothetical protein E1294_03770 [Nonomuraea diastatica]
MRLGTRLVGGSAVRARAVLSAVAPKVIAMGVPWGIEEYSSKYDRDMVLEDWTPFAEAALNMRRSFGIMHGDVRVEFRKRKLADGRSEVYTTETPAPAARAQIDRLSMGDGTYDMFDQIMDGYDIFLPWTSKERSWTVKTPDRVWYVTTLDVLIGTTYRTDDLDDDPSLQKLAGELCRAGVVAQKYKLAVGISY